MRKGHSIVGHIEVLSHFSQEILFNLGQVFLNAMLYLGMQKNIFCQKFWRRKKYFHVRNLHFLDQLKLKIISL